ncbi:hypothetical protein ABTD92_20960, partial [Acinetobacter baumannii]
GNYTETLSKDGKEVSKTTHTKTDDNGSYSDTKDGPDGAKSTKTVDGKTGHAHTETTDKDNNKTVRDEEKDGSYKSRTTDSKDRET